VSLCSTNVSGLAYCFISCLNFQLSILPHFYVSIDISAVLIARFAVVSHLRNMSIEAYIYIYIYILL
jgi:hypothetical protein